MSGKPATPPASRAALPGAPRVLVYVADQRQLEAPPSPHDARHRFDFPAFTRDERAAVEGAVLYKTVDDNGGYGIPEDPVSRTDFYAVSGSFVKHQNIKIEDCKIDTDLIASSNFRGRVVTDSTDSQSYQMRCPSRQASVTRLRVSNSTRSGFVSDDVHNNSENNKDYGCVNYQFVEQSLTNQGSVNDQVSVQGVEGEAGSPTAHISVPLGWRRIFSGISVLYISPSGTALGTLAQLREYLQTSGTCKCGLPCPLRPENTFSFDPKVASKPYQTPTGSELAKLCNHKRKLLATLNARGNATPPPQPDKKGGDMAVLVKKMKRPASHMSNQLIIQKEKTITEYKTYQQQQQRQDGEQMRTGSPIVQMRINSQSCPPAFNTSQHLATNIVAVSETSEIHKTDFQIQRTSSHYLTVNSGWINPEPTQKPSHITQGNMNIGQPVLGTNGQVIGVNTSGTKGPKSMQQIEHEQKEEKKAMLELCNQDLKQNSKEEESHVFCGLNQPLTPEVMQKINEQQQIFIQQNQKQIEMAMKGYRPQMAENVNTHVGKSQCQRNYLPQGQLIIQNGTVMKTNPGKMPPWQVKSQANNSKLQRTEDVEYDDAMMNAADDVSGRSSVQPICSRVPPLPQHYSTLTVQHWPTEPTKKKSKSKSKKKKEAHADKHLHYGNNGMRVLEESKMKINNDHCNNNPIPSFMDDPNGYLAQQTALLNNTISRQVGSNNSYESGVFGNSSGNYTGLQNDYDKNVKTKMNDAQYRNNLAPNCSPSPNTTPDSSVLLDKMSDPTQCTKGCNPAAKITCAEHYHQNVMRRNFSRQNFNTMEFGGNSRMPNKSMDDSPVTSSTLMERDETIDRPQEGAQMMHFISNHHINKNLNDMDNVSYLGSRKRSNAMPGYCPPPHLGGGAAATLVQASYVQSCGMTTFAGSLSVTRNTFTSVLAGRARTSTTSINASSPNFIRPPPPPSVDLATSYAIPTNRPDPFINSVNLPTSYPLHIAGTTAQSMISKSPLEMMQNVIGNSTGIKSEKTNNPSQILISSSKQIVLSSGTPMPPPPPKSTSSGVLLNTLPAPFVLPSVMVDGQVMPQLMGGLVTSGPSPAASPRQMQGMALLSPESVTKKSKKKKSATNVLQITANQQNSNIVVHHTSPQHNTSPQFSPRGFQLSPNNNLNSSVLQALTIVPGKTGPPHIVMGGQGNTNNFGSQQIISNTSPSQQINLLQPVNLLNNTAGVVSNFPAFQQFIVPNIGGMMMTADGTIIQDNSTGVQLQLQTVNGQNVLTPVQNFNANTGVVIRAQNQQGKLIQNQHSPQFLSPNFNSQLSPLLANLSPTNLGYRNDFIHGGSLSPRGRTVSTQTLGQQRGGKSPSKSPGAAAGCSPPDTTTLSPLGPLEAASPRRPQPLADTTTKSPEPNDSNSLAMVQCVSSSEQDMAEQSEHPAWSAMPVEYAAETDTQNTMSNMQIVRHPRGYNQTISVTSVNNQHSLTITPGGYYERGHKRKQESLETQNKVPRSSFPQPPAPEYDQPSPYDPPYDQNPPSFPSLDRHNDPVLDKFRAGDVVWGPYGGHPWWPAQLTGARGGRWDVRWFGGHRGTTVLPARRLLSLTQGLEYYAATRAGRRKSRKLNIHLENAIQEAMAELDKTSEPSSESSDPTPKPSSSEVPKKLKKQTGRSKILKKTKTGKVSSGSVGENTRLRNNR